MSLYEVLNIVVLGHQHQHDRLKQINMNPKKCWMLNKNNQNQRFINVLPFETMAIMTRCSFFARKMLRNSNSKSIRFTCSVGFDLGCLKINTY